MHIWNAVKFSAFGVIQILMIFREREMEQKRWPQQRRRRQRRASERANERTHEMRALCCNHEFLFNWLFRRYKTQTTVDSQHQLAAMATAAPSRARLCVCVWETAFNRSVNENESTLSIEYAAQQQQHVVRMHRDDNFSFAACIRVAVFVFVYFRFRMRTQIAAATHCLVDFAIARVRTLALACSLAIKTQRNESNALPRNRAADTFLYLNSFVAGKSSYPNEWKLENRCRCFACNTAAQHFESTFDSNVNGYALRRRGLILIAIVRYLDYVFIEFAAIFSHFSSSLSLSFSHLCSIEIDRMIVLSTQLRWRQLNFIHEVIRCKIHTKFISSSRRVFSSSFDTSKCNSHRNRRFMRRKYKNVFRFSFVRFEIFEWFFYYLSRWSMHMFPLFSSISLPNSFSTCPAHNHSSAIVNSLDLFLYFEFWVHEILSEPQLQLRLTKKKGKKKNRVRDEGWTMCNDRRRFFLFFLLLRLFIVVMAWKATFRMITKKNIRRRKKQRNGQG